MSAILKSTARGAAGFGAGAALFCGGLLASAAAERAAGAKGAMGFTTFVVLTSFLGAGALGVVVLRWGTASAGELLRGALGFAAGMFATLIGVLFTMISLQGGGRPDYAWGAIGFGVSFAVGAGIGTAFIDCRLAAPSALGFGIPGAIAGMLIFYGSTLSGWNASPGAAPAGLISTAAVLLPFVAGGAALGAMMGWQGRD